MTKLSHHLFTLTTYQLRSQNLRIVHCIQNLKKYLNTFVGVRLPQTWLPKEIQQLEVFCSSRCWNFNFGISKVHFLLSFWSFWDMIWKDVSFFSLDKHFKLHLWPSFHAKFGHKDKCFIQVTKCEQMDSSPTCIFLTIKKYLFQFWWHPHIGQIHSDILVYEKRWGNKTYQSTSMSLGWASWFLTKLSGCWCGIG